MGRRYSKSVDGVITTFLNDGVEEIADYDASGNIMRRYVNGPGVDERLAYYEYNNGGTQTAKHYSHVDWQGSVIAATDSTGAIVDTNEYDSFGNPSNGLGNPFKYTGRRWDDEVGLYYYRARYYHPTLGRFLQTDPVGYADNMNMYAYVGNDPMNNTDPSGEFLANLVGAIVGAAVEVGYQMVVEGKDFQDVDVGDVAVAAVAGATGTGALKQATKLLKAVKNIKKSQKNVKRAKKYTDNKKAEGSKTKTENAKFREGEAQDGLDNAGKKLVEKSAKAAGATGGASAAKEASPEVTVKDILKDEEQ